MKKILLLLASLLAFSVTKAQNTNPITWQAAYKAISATEGEITITGVIEKGWHTYSQRPTDAGPIPTSLKFTEAKDYTLVGKTTESDAHEEYVKAFEAKVFVFSGKAEFKQKIKINSKKPLTVALKLEYMCCNDMMCLPPKIIDLSVKVQ